MRIFVIINRYESYEFQVGTQKFWFCFLFDVSGVRNANMQYVLLKGLDKKQDFSKSDEAKEAVLQAAAELVKNMDG